MGTRRDAIWRRILSRVQLVPKPGAGHSVAGPNKRNINLVIKSIRGEIARTKSKYVGFNMDEFIGSAFDYPDKPGRSCATIVCIAGHAFLLAWASKNSSETWINRARSNFDRDAARDFLGLTDDQADELFYEDGVKLLRQIEPHEAIKALEILRDTGEVNWAEAIAS